ncbi:hypothetical protein Sme01_37580 [Sphaerisporangium melleum]|uniref:Protein kinase domain-containing protein n=1 Tax=Sphaerisporangium melleum TaxID=321316 RepID=A0A917RB65_9ACTN|nr:serine/threonine-protein kinase [Sphaerisporangium melleum]GGK99915.1 hypothetical protein GCM10007964_47510 [Sphaerisporangium melleum]GII71282.1 hypothetical protein Sme01_37580 [Sphaerisporangium melleum]
MPQASPLLTDDPSELGRYHLLGRLGAGAVSTVYLAQGPDEEQVAIKLLHEGLAGADRFLAKVNELQHVSAFCTAQVIETGMAGERPYVVSEYIAGPTLRQVVEQDGPLYGTALHRLAIGTMTALVAGHQAGLAHRAFGPRGVLLGPGGPRVIDFGVAEVLDAGMSGTTRSLDGLAYLTPEQLDGAAAGPASDMFAWGATMLFAASGRAPFDAGGMPATINKIMRGEPDLSVLDGDLLSLVAECLSKDPARRPTSGEALLRLVGHAQMLGTLELTAAAPRPPDATPAPAPGPRAGQAAPPPPDPGTPVELPPPHPADVPPPPPKPAGGRRRVLALVAGAVAIAFASGGTVYALTPRATPTPVARPAPAPAPTPSAAVIPASPSPPAPPTTDLTLPGSGIRLHENPADPYRLNAYFIQDHDGERFETYARDAGADTFGKIAENAASGDPAVSPDGTWVAVNPRLTFSSSGHDSVVFHNRRTGERFSVDTLDRPLRGLSGVWSRDGKRYLLTFYQRRADKKTQYPGGFVVVDVTTRKATVVMTDDRQDGAGDFDWSPDGAYIVGAYETGSKPRYGMRFRDMKGNVVRTLPWVGRIPGPGVFSPSGTSFFTYCPASEPTTTAICVWNLGSGNRTATIPAWDDLSVQGWWDENHLLVYDRRKADKKYVVLDFHGKIRRTLADVPEKDAATTLVRFGPN